MSDTQTASRRPFVKKVALIALFAALISAGTFIAIPLPFSPIPIVLQNLLVVLAGLILGPVAGALAVAVYLIEGAIGLPVFAGARGGIAVFLGPTGGYLAGYFLSALVAGCIAGSPRIERKTPLWRLAIAILAGFAVVYIPGVARLSFALGGNWTKAIAAGFLPFIIGDLVKAIIAIAIVPRLRRTSADLLND